MPRIDQQKNTSECILLGCDVFTDDAVFMVVVDRTSGRGERSYDARGLHDRPKKSFNLLFPVSTMQIKSSSGSRADPEHVQPEPAKSALANSNSTTVQDLVERVKGPEAVKQLDQLVQEAHDLDIQLFHYAAAIGDRDFFSIMMAFLPLGTLTEELRRPNQNGMTPIECAKTVHSSLATSIEAFLLTRGVDSKPESSSTLLAVGPQTSAPHRALDLVGAVEDDTNMKRVQVSPSRYFDCSIVASTVGETLRANGIYYAAARAVYVRHVRSDKLNELAQYGCELLAFPESNETSGGLWTGSKIAELAQEERFRATFKIYSPFGDHPCTFLSGGNAGDPFKFNIREKHDFGYDNRRVMIKLPDDGIVFCRGVGGDCKNPKMACVLFDAEGNVRDQYGYKGKLGRWNDIFQ
ncbi:unnamed protein product [Phytophthora fragariaefolia]|uniref:Unnamed protein product n=1 Tax=Phytophthora fragariaefolia TaxID=1490495 RepID=A0A9W6XT87_9STRA|nr:unnamed protein product [Phytophthora fragariaefolia]